MDTKHTPGPWRHGHPSGYHVDKVYANDGETAIVQVYGIPINCQLRDIDLTRYGEKVATARLIAAAPDLLYVLQQILNDLPTKRDWLDPLLEQHARAATANAQGSTPAAPSEE